MDEATRAETLTYSLELPASQVVGFNIDLDVDHAGPLVLEGDWSDDRVLSFRLDRPGSRERPVRRTGPPPLRLEVDVAGFEPGVYASMHNRVLRFPGVKKDRQRGTFVPA